MRPHTDADDTTHRDAIFHSAHALVASFIDREAADREAIAWDDSGICPENIIVHESHRDGAPIFLVIGW